MTREEKRRLEPRDYLTLTLSAFALLISAGSGYLSILRTVESVSLIWNTEPLPSINNNMLIVSSESRGELIFANSGNTAVVVSSIVVFYMQPREATSTECRPDSGVNIDTDFEPTVLKPNDVIIRKIKLSAARLYFATSIKAIQTPGGFEIPFETFNQNKNDVLIDVCLDITLSSPSATLYSITLPAFRYHATEKGWTYAPETEGPLQRTPALLLRRTGTIFDN